LCTSDQGTPQLRSATLMHSMSIEDPRRAGRPTWIEVNLDQIAANVRAVSRIVGTHCRIMAVVKANGYGHGAEMIAESAIAAGANSLAVATVDEGILLRRSGIRAPILVLSPIAPGEVRRALEFDLSLTIATREMAEIAASESARLGGDAAEVHLKLDSGMHRYGTEPSGLLAVARFVHSANGLHLAGVYTHFADADATDLEFTDEQMGVFQEFIATLSAEGIAPGFVHASNSAALLAHPRFHLNMVRLGIALYGLPPSLEFRLPGEIKPALSLKSTVCRVIELEPGDTVSYGRTYRAGTREHAALVPVGYADGLRRDLSNRGEMAIQGTRVPIIGRVCMDQTVVKVVEEEPAHLGDMVDVIGTGDANELTFTEVARELDTIPYELVTGLSIRIPRYYWRGGRIVACRDLQGLNVFDTAPTAER
jgi:alanine racemase